MERLEQLKKEIESIKITNDLQSVYCGLINATIDYQNDTQTWDFEYIFEDFINDDILADAVKDNLERFGVWAVKNLLDDINDEVGVYRIDAYGYGHDITMDDLEEIKEQIMGVINDLESKEV